MEQDSRTWKFLLVEDVEADRHEGRAEYMPALSESASRSGIDAAAIGQPAMDVESAAG
jgi:hypothetical protein